MSFTSYVTLGRSGLRVSPFTLGTMTFGEDLGRGQPGGVGEDPGGLPTGVATRWTRPTSAPTATPRSSSATTSPAGRAPRPDRARHQVLLEPPPGDRNGGGPGRKASLQQLENSLRRLGPTTSTSSGCTTSIRSPRWKKPSAYWTIWSRRARCAMSGSLTCRPGRQRSRDHRALPRLGADDRPAAGVQPARANSQGELIPMAQSMGMGVMPWGPLRSGFSQASTPLRRPGR